MRVLRVSILFRGGDHKDDNEYKRSLFNALCSTGCPFTNQAYNNYTAADITDAQLAAAMTAFWNRVNTESAAGKRLDHFWMQAEAYENS